jgi:uncharacterized membrane protein|tara:strand:+ start:1300 stop:2523 length:1224 start_codon:yes stop_codon:yes gene_type:complete
MYDFAVLWEWLSFGLRWLHVITAMAWIGSSFYFIALDLGLNRNIEGPADGEEWQVHGGGFYHVQKYLVAPAAMPEHLTWFKWESYTTWLSGVALLMVMYWAGSELYLIDPEKMDLLPWQAIVISAGSLAIGWLIYDYLCKSKLGERPTVLMFLLFLVLAAMSWGYDQVFTGRAALLHLGAFTATIMTANVAMVIMPNQRVVVADLKAGRVPDPKYGKIAKLRSTHNNYLTLPVIFLMLSNHYPLAFGTPYAWIIACLVFLMGVSIRHYFNSMHSRTGKPNWTWGLTLILFVLIAWLSSIRHFDGDNESVKAISLTIYEERFAQADGFEDAHKIVQGRCGMCHAREPVWEGIIWAPKGVLLETRADIAKNAHSIYLQAGISHAMPPGNITNISQKDRTVLVNWYRSVN